MDENKVPVFDDFGRFVGWFTPAGSNWAVFLAWLIALLILMAVALPFWLLWKGYQLWKNGQGEAALLAWAVGAATIILPAVLIWNSHHTQQVEARQRVERQAAWRQEVEQAKGNLENLVVVTLLRQSIPEAALGCKYHCDTHYSEYQVVNNSPLTIEIGSTLNLAAEHCTQRLGWIADIVKPHSTLTVYCPEATSFRATSTPHCLNIRDYGDRSIKRTICDRRGTS